MSFASKCFTSFIQNGFRNITGNGVTLSARALGRNPIASNVVSPLSVITGLQRLLAPVSSLINQVSGFKVKGRLKRRCKDCYFVVRHQRHYVICPTHPRHKQMSMKKRDYKSWILTHATQSKVRPY